MPVARRESARARARASYSSHEPKARTATADGLDPLKAWQRLTTSCRVVVELPRFNLLDIVWNIT